MKIEFFQYCTSKLGAHSFVIFQALKLMQADHESETSIARIAEVSGSSRHTISRQLAALQKKGFLLYRTICGVGVLVFWLRSSESEKIPQIGSVTKDYEIVVRKVGQKRSQVILPGDIKKFCRKNKLAEASLKRLRDGKIRVANGWELVG